MSRAAKLGAQGLALAAVAGLLGLLVWRVTHQAHAPKVGGPAPSFSAGLLNGGTLDLASLRGKAVVINFFQSYCDPCKVESQALETAYRKSRGSGVVFLGVDYYDFAKDARRFVQKHGVTYPIVRDQNGAIATRYGITGTPETFFVDRRGRLVGSHVVGPINHGDNVSLFRDSLAVAARRS
jgi:cytochrome c biogenesis protein CcmG, thiol:disulfide interchange protein DsbE